MALNYKLPSYLGEESQAFFEHLTIDKDKMNNLIKAADGMAHTQTNRADPQTVRELINWCLYGQELADATSGAR